LKYETSNLIDIQTNDNLVILTLKIYTLIALTTFLEKCKKCNECLHRGTEGVFATLKSYNQCNICIQIIFLK